MPVTPEQRKGADGTCETVMRNGVRVNKDAADSPVGVAPEERPKRGGKKGSTKKASKKRGGKSGETSRAEAESEQAKDE